MRKKLWEKCVAFHGHECGGLTIGFQAALYAIELLGLKPDESPTIDESKEGEEITDNPDIRFSKLDQIDKYYENY